MRASAETFLWLLAEAITRSPVYSLVGECLMGVTSIRAYSDASRFTSKLFELVDGKLDSSFLAHVADAPVVLVSRHESAFFLFMARQSLA
jgi:hypothetical protein